MKNTLLLLSNGFINLTYIVTLVAVRTGHAVVFGRSTALVRASDVAISKMEQTVVFSSTYLLAAVTSSGTMLSRVTTNSIIVYARFVVSDAC